MIQSAHLLQRASGPGLQYVIERTAAAPTAHLRGVCGPVLPHTVLTAPASQDRLHPHLSDTPVYMSPLRLPLPTTNRITRCMPLHTIIHTCTDTHSQVLHRVASPTMHPVRTHFLRRPYIQAILLHLLPNLMPLACNSITILLSPLVGTTLSNLNLSHIHLPNNSLIKLQELP